MVREKPSNRQRAEFAGEAERQAKLLNGRPEEREAQAFIEAAFAWPEPKISSPAKTSQEARQRDLFMSR